MSRVAKTCEVTATVSTPLMLTETRKWTVDVMKTSVTRAWCTRKFNAAVRAGSRVFITWDCFDGNNRLSGHLARSGRITVKRRSSASEG